MATSMLLALLQLGEHITDKENITGNSRVHRNGMHKEVLKHIKNELNPQILVIQ